MATQVETAGRDVVFVEDAHTRPMMGLEILEPLPSAHIPWASARRARRSQVAVLGPGRDLTVVDATPGTRFMLMTGKPYGEATIYNGPYVD
jgi:hypothetical protein